MSEKRKRRGQDDEVDLDAATQVEPSQSSAPSEKRARTREPVAESDDDEKSIVSEDSESEGGGRGSSEEDSSDESGLDEDDLARLAAKRKEKGKKKQLTAAERAERAARRYIDDIADVDEDIDEDEDDLGGADTVDFIDEQEGAATAAELADLRRQMSEQPRGPRGVSAFDGEDLDEEDMERRLEDRYRDYGQAEDDVGRGVPGSKEALLDAAFWAPGQSLGSNIDQQARLPTAKDPQLFFVPCRPGREAEAIVCIMNKAITLAKAGQPLTIRSAVSPDHIKGSIYIEADKESHVSECIQGLSMLQHWKSKKVALEDMPKVMKVVNSTALVKEGSWVRIKRGNYAGDLAQVVVGEDASGDVTIKVIPRLDYEHIAQKNKYGGGGMRNRMLAEEHRAAAASASAAAGNTPAVTGAADGDNAANPNADDTLANPGSEAPGVGGKKKRVKRPKPKAKFLDLDALTEARARIEKRRDHDGEWVISFDNMNFKKGYLLREARVTALITEGVKPTIDELQRFQSGNEDEEESSSATAESLGVLMGEASANRSVQFNAGDSVIVAEGDLRDLTGKVIKVDKQNGRVTIMPTLDDLTDPLELDMHQLQKHFQTGSHVKITRGKHDNMTGMVVRVDGNIVHVWSDLTQQEVQVFADDVTEASEVSAALAGNSLYSVFDLVEFASSGGASRSTAGNASQGNNETGIIVSRLQSSVKILDSSGDVRTITNNHVLRKLLAKSGAGLDSDQNRVGDGDHVKVIQGPHRDMSGTVKAVWKSTAFIHCRNEARNAGIIAVPCRHLSVGMGLAGNRSRTGAGLLAARVGFGALAPGASRSGGYGGGGGAGANGRANLLRTGTDKRKDPLMAKRIRITGGNHKGLVGIVKDVTDVNVRVELQSKSKMVTVPRNKVVEVDANGRPLTDLPPRAGGSRGSHDPGAATPFHDVRYAGSATPMHASGATPSHPGIEGFDPSRTPMHSGVQAPATPGRMDTMGGWDNPGSSAYTPMGGGATTPMSGPTPSMGNAATPMGGMSYGEADAYTPAMGGAPTPSQGGMDYAPTPYGGGPDTPGVGSMDMTAPTPGMGMGAPTPGVGMGAPTPAIGMGAPTPGMGMGAPTPAIGMGAPTPGMGMGAPTPGPGMGAPTPAIGMPAPTPAAGGYHPAPQFGAPTPAPGMGAPSPAVAGGMAPTPAVGPTPGVGSSWGMDGQTGGGGEGEGESAPVASATAWVSPDVEAVVTSSGPHEGAKGTIRSINAENQVELYVPEIDEAIFVSAADLKPTEPTKKDRVKVLAPAEAAGMLGELVSIFQGDGIVRMEEDQELRFFALHSLGRYLAAQ